MTFRSGGKNAIPAFMARSGLPARSGWPSTTTCPPSRISDPKIAPNATSRPDPATPASPTRSPARTDNDRERNGPDASSRTSIIGAPCSDERLRDARLTSSSSLPTSNSISAGLVRERIGLVATFRPFLSTETLSATRNSSSIRCVTYRTATPVSAALRTICRTCRTSATGSAAVGSSSTNTSTGKWTILAQRPRDRDTGLEWQPTVTPPPVAGRDPTRSGRDLGPRARRTSPYGSFRTATQNPLRSEVVQAPTTCRSDRGPGARTGSHAHTADGRAEP